MAKLVDKTYGQALFELGLEENKIETYAQQIADIRSLFEENPDLMKLLTHPQISGEDKLKVVEQCFNGKADNDITQFLKIVVKAGRQSELIHIFNYFLESVKVYKHIGTAYVTSAVSLTQEQKEAVEKRLLELTDFVSYDMIYEIDPSIIGGLIIRIGDKVVDSSIKTKLETISKELLAIQLGNVE